jgi:hypothetical protein
MTLEVADFTDGKLSLTGQDAANPHLEGHALAGIQPNFAGLDDTRGRLLCR